MGLGGISIWQLAIVLGIVILIFGTRKLRNVGGDLGGALKSFRSAMREGEDNPANDATPASDTSKPSAPGSDAKNEDGSSDVRRD